MPPSDLTLGDLNWPNSKSLKIAQRKELKLTHMLLLNTNRKSYIGSPTAPLNFWTLSEIQGSKSRSFRFLVIADLYVTYIFAGNILTWMSYGRVWGRSCFPFFSLSCILFHCAPIPPPRSNFHHKRRLQNVKFAKFSAIQHSTFVRARDLNI